MSDYPRTVTPSEAAEMLIRQAGMLGSDEIAVVRNPSYVYAPVELYPLAPKVTGPLDWVAGVVMDMDGTTTTTEPLCLHSLEWMVRRISVVRDYGAWVGLDREKDYPHIIGNSTTKHVEYLMSTYGSWFSAPECLCSYLEAAAWTLSHGQDPGRRDAILADIPALGLSAVWEDEDFAALSAPHGFQTDTALEMAQRLAETLLPDFRCESLADRVRAGIDIYYMRYHQILADIAIGKAADRAEEIFGRKDSRLVEPMPAVGIYLAAVKGWLGDDLGNFTDLLIEKSRKRHSGAKIPSPATARKRLAAIGRVFAENPAPVGVVTSSIAYEADIVLGEVFRILRKSIADWPIDAALRADLIGRFANPREFYDAFITADHSSEIRLKPHRDLYAIALHTMGIPPSDYCRTVGFEDSESGITAIRASGIGLAVAVPFADTSGHNLSQAAHVLHGGMAEVLLEYGAFLV
jgi:beta-phosphoglucomutase-like phosphatase (HAD superfamily)